jgi:hypothetical protein
MAALNPRCLAIDFGHYNVRGRRIRRALISARISPNLLDDFSTGFFSSMVAKAAMILPQ